LSKGIPDESGNGHVSEAVVGNPYPFSAVEIHASSFHPIPNETGWDIPETDIAIAIPLRDAVPRLFRSHVWLLSNCYGIWGITFPCT
jgi:hypothetical protein